MATYDAGDAALFHDGSTSIIPSTIPVRIATASCGCRIADGRRGEGGSGAAAAALGLLGLAVVTSRVRARGS
jgi:hypothetical protein